MICRGLVISVLDRYTAKVRIPIIHRDSGSPDATSDIDIPEACICTLPNADPNIQVGDVVIIGFENNDLGKPIILGYLYRDISNNTAISIDLKSVIIENSASLPEVTSIGDVTPDMIKNLKDSRDNIQNQIDMLKESINSIEKQLKKFIDSK